MNVRLIRPLIVSVIVTWVMTSGRTAADATPSQGRTIAPGAIGGTVISAATGVGVRNAKVRVSGLGSAPGAPVDREILSDADGHFLFRDLPTGRFAIFVTHDDFRPAEFGQSKPGEIGTPIVLAEGQTRQITVPLWRGGAISGVIRDEDDEPVVGATVRLLTYFVNQNNVRRLRIAQAVISDDRGAYRFFGLDPIEYRVAATPPLSGLLMSPPNSDDGTPSLRTAPIVVQDGVPMVQTVGGQDGNDNRFAPTYYPQSTTAGGSLGLVADPSGERSGVDIQIVSRRTGRVRGIVGGVPAPNTPVQVLLHNTEAEEESTSLTAMAGATGEFELRNIIPGRYLVYAQTLPPRDQAAPAPEVQTVRVTAFERLHGRSPVLVEPDRTTVVSIELRPGRSISGRVAFAPNVARPPNARTTISITPAPQPTGLPAFNTSPQVTTAADGTFTLPGIRPGRYLLRASGPGTVASVMWSGMDTLDDPLEVTADADVTDVVIALTDRVSEVSGRVTDPDGQPAYGYTVIVATTNPRYWGPGARRIQITRPSVDGRYAIGGLPAGDYRVAVVRDYNPVAPLDATTLPALLGNSVAITVIDGGRTTQDLKVER